MFEKLHDLGSRVRHTPVLERQRWLWDTVEPAWQRMFARISDQQGFATHINGDIFKLTYEWGSRYDRLDQRAYEPVVYAALTEAIREGMTVFDIGAHIGMFTLGTAKRVGSKGRVYAFEPSPETALILERHVALNAWQDRVEVVRAVASDLNGKVPFYVNGISMAASLGRENVEVLSPDRPADGAVKLEMESVTLDQFCERGHIQPDVFKIDVEGAELRVLRGAGNLLLTRCLLILCEVHPKQMQYCGSSIDELHAYLEDVGYSLEPLDQPNPMGIFHSRMSPRPR